MSDEVRMPLSAAQDPKLTWAAKGLLLYLASLPRYATPKEAELIQASPGGRDHLRGVLRELEAAGYLTRMRARGHDGRATGTHFSIHIQTPNTEATNV